MNKSHLSFFGQDQTNVSLRERLRAAGGAVVGLLFTMAVGRYVGGLLDSSLWVMASLGASALLVFVLPSSPMAQPWAVIGGNVISALIGISCVYLFGDPLLAAPVAVGLAIVGMFVLRCLHPPAAAVAMIAVLGSIADFQFVLFPVLTESLLLVLMGVFYNNLTGKRYPNLSILNSRTLAHPTVHERDIDAVLSRYNQVIDINRADLAGLISQVETSAYEAKLESIKCADIMTVAVLSLEVFTPLEVAWKTLRDKHIKAMPVIDRGRRVVGMVTVEDFLQHANIDFHQNFGQRMRGFLRGRLKGIEKSLTAYPNAVGQIMTKKVRVISESRNVMDLVGIFHGQGHHHLPVIDAHQRLVGIITQSDFVAAIEKSLHQL